MVLPAGWKVNLVFKAQVLGAVTGPMKPKWPRPSPRIDAFRLARSEGDSYVEGDEDDLVSPLIDGDGPTTK